MACGNGRARPQVAEEGEDVLRVGRALDGGKRLVGKPRLETPLEVGVEGIAASAELQAFDAGPAAQLGDGADLSSEELSLADRLGEASVLTDAAETAWVSVL